MKKVIFTGFWDRQARLIIQGIKDSGEINVPCIIGDEAYTLTPEELVSGESFPAVTELDADLIMLLSSQYEHLLLFQLMMERRGENWKNVNETKILFLKMLAYARDIILENDPDILVFSNVPHEGFDYILYLVCIYYKVKTFIVFQSIFPNKFFITDSIDNVGFFEKKKFKDTSIASIKAPDSLVMPNMDSTFKRSYFRKLLNAISYVFSDKEQLLIKLTRKVRNRAYKREIQNNLTLAQLRNLQLDSSKVVYFPLHLQPEMTSVSLAGFFEEQLFAIQHLRSMLPDDWSILVKENPKQDYFQRGKFFFEGLRSIKNTFLVDQSVSTKELLENSFMVATLTGSAGWESIISGKKTIAYGKAWYRSFPNVLSYPFDKTDFVKFIDDHSYGKQDVNSYLDVFLENSFSGIVDQDYNSVYDGYDFKKNIFLTKMSLLSFLKTV